MPGQGPQPSPRRARRAESYEAKCERRQEAWESRCSRPNVTTCRLAGGHAGHRERLHKARQQLFLQRRNLGAEEPGGVPRAPSQGQVPPAEPLSTAPRQQVAVSPGAGMCRGPAGRLPSQSRPPTAESHPSQQPPRQHRGTQTQPRVALPTMKNDASQQTNYGVAVLDKDIIQLSEYLKEALQRELVVKQKMVVLQDLLSALLQASDSSWKGQLNEDKLKDKLRSLENQLFTCTQRQAPWGVKKALLQMEAERSSLEQKAKESLQRALQERLQLQSTQRSLALAEQKCEEWKCQCEALKEDCSSLGARCQELESRLHMLQSKLQSS